MERGWSNIKGRLFEEAVAKYFTALGFKVRRNVQVTGLSGAHHEVDLLVEGGDGRRGLVEVKNHSEPIPKEWVMKAFQVARDIGVDEVYVVSASGFTPDARRVAEILDVKTLGLEEMASVVRARRSISNVKTGFLEPVLSGDGAARYASRLAVRRLLIPIERVVGVDLAYRPLYIVRGTVTFRRAEGLILKREVEVLRDELVPVDGVNGGIPNPSKETLLVKGLLGLDEMALTALSTLARKRGSAREVRRELGREADRHIRSLRSRGLIFFDKSSGAWVPRLPTLGALRRFIKSLPPARSGPPPTRAVDVKVLPGVARRIAESLYGLRDTSAELLYIPVYSVRMERRDGSYRYVYVSGWTRHPLALQWE